jgi:hypothetical protein
MKLSMSLLCLSAVIVLALFCLSSTGFGEEEASPAEKEEPVSPEREHSVTAADPGPGGKLSLTVKQGKHYVFTFKAWETEITTEPQMAFWLEDEEGSSVRTIYVTFKYATQDWFAPPGVDREEIRRPSSLPIWTRRHTKRGAGNEELCKACHERHNVKGGSTTPEPPLDAVTAATPKWGFTREWAVPTKLEPGKYTVLAEINNAMDANETYWVPSADRPPDEDDKNYGGTSGQPSILWSGVLEVGEGPTSVSLMKVGHGHPAGRDGSIGADLSLLTTALEIVDSIRVDFTPPE